MSDEIECSPNTIANTESEVIVSVTKPKRVLSEKQKENIVKARAKRQELCKERQRIKEEEKMIKAREKLEKMGASRSNSKKLEEVKSTVKIIAETNTPSIEEQSSDDSEIECRKSKDRLLTSSTKLRKDKKGYYVILDSESESDSSTNSPYSQRSEELKIKPKRRRETKKVKEPVRPRTQEPKVSQVNVDTNKICTEVYKLRFV